MTGRRIFRWLVSLFVISYVALSLAYSGDGYAPRHRRNRDNSNERLPPPATATAVPLAGPGEPSGTILCLSGGGYRAMLFHVGVLWRLNEAGFLSKLDAVSSVSGGSIVSGVLATRWRQLDFNASGVATKFQPEVVAPLRGLAAATIDAPAIGMGLSTPWTTGDGIVKAYGSLFGSTTLQDFPSVPIFYINATNMQTGVGWRFSKGSMGDWRIGYTRNPELDVAVAVAASSSFPPFLAPLKLDLRGLSFKAVLHTEPQYYEYALLLDGGVEDNLGLGPTRPFETVLISDGGGASMPIADPATDWFSITARVLALIHDQPSALRKRQAVTDFVHGIKKGTYFGMRLDIGDYKISDPLPMPAELTKQLSMIPTRLAKLDDRTQKNLINWGYIVADAAIRSHVDTSISRPTGVPYPDALQ